MFMYIYICVYIHRAFKNNRMNKKTEMLWALWVVLRHLAEKKRLTHREHHPPPCPSVEPQHVSTMTYQYNALFEFLLPAKIVSHGTHAEPETAP